MSSSNSHSSSISTDYMEKVADRPKTQALRSITKRNYHKIWYLFNKFLIRLDKIPNNWEEKLVLFVAHCIQNGNSIKSKGNNSKTVRSYISAIRMTLKQDGIFLNDKQYQLTAMTRACRQINDRVFSRLPTGKNLLRMILDNLGEIFDKQQYLLVLYRAILITGYYGLFRIGELVTGDHLIRVSDVHIGENKNKIQIVLKTSKTHGLGDQPQVVKIIN